MEKNIGHAVGSIPTFRPITDKKIHDGVIRASRCFSNNSLGTVPKMFIAIEQGSSKILLSRKWCEVLLKLCDRWDIK
jgi:hypothetical protein